MGSQLPPIRGTAPSFRFMSIVAKKKTPLSTEVDLGPGNIVLDRVPAARERGTAAPPPPLFGHVYCGHSRPSQLLLSSCKALFA